MTLNQLPEGDAGGIAIVNANWDWDDTQTETTVYITTYQTI